MLVTRNKRLREIAGVLETGNLLLLRLALRDPAKARSYPGLVFREYIKLAGRGRWRSAPIEDLYPSFRGARIVVEHLPGEGLATSLEELAYLALVTRLEQPRTIFEIGTFRGRTALNFALNSPEDCAVYTLDLPPETHPSGDLAPADRRLAEASAPGADFAGKEEARKITQLLGDSLVFDFTPYEGRMDLVFVDGAHHYDAARSDSENALRMARPGGLVVWHDFANYGDYNDVTRAVLDSVPGDRVVQIESSQLAVYRKPAA